MQRATLSDVVELRTGDRTCEQHVYLYETLQHQVIKLLNLKSLMLKLMSRPFIN